MSANAIRAAATGGTAVSGSYNQGNTSAVKVYSKDGALYWTSGMSIDCDGQPGSKCSKSTDPYFQAQTAFTQSDGKALKAEELPFVVVPLASSIWDYRKNGLRGGDLVVMAYKEKYVFGVVGDLGPSSRIGEASYAAAAALGINPDPKVGGVGSGVTYVAFPGVRVSPIESKAEAVRVGTAKLAEWLGTVVTPEPPEGGSELTSVDKIIAEAEKTLGLGEPNYIQTWYESKWGDLGGNWAWCNAAVTYWAHKSGNAVAVCFGDNKGFAYTVYHAQEFKDRGQWTFGTSGIRRGDIVFFDWAGADSIAAIDHVGIVTGVRADGKVETIEGNIENACRRKVRGSLEIAGYGRPKYSDVPSTPPPPAGKPKVKLSDAVAKTDAATRVIQAALNTEYGGVVVDGDYGPQTAAAYTRWQKSLGWPGDGLPGAHSLSELGKKRGFDVDLEGATATPPGGATPPPPPAPEPEPEPEPEVPTVPVVIFEEVGPSGTAAANKVVQAALHKFKPPVVVDGDYGPQTKGAYSAWQKSLGFTGSDADGLPGMTSLTRLAARYGFTVKRRADVPSTPTPKPPPAPKPTPTTPPSVENYLTQPEPAHNYSRVSYGGRTVNVRTREMLKLAASWTGVTMVLSQGSYNPGGVSASAGTHDGGGVVDISVSAWSSSKRNAVVLALRKAGFAAWLRTPAEGFAYHIHACAIGDREMASGAKNQVQAYFNRRNGLANNGADNSEHRWPNWCDRYQA